MSTLNVSNITDGTTTVGTSYVVNGSAKAWCNFKGTSTLTVHDSMNTSSVTDQGTGNYDVNFNNNFATASNNNVTTSSNWRGIICPDVWNVAYVKVYGADNNGTTQQDRGHVSTAFHGDLA